MKDDKVTTMSNEAIKRTLSPQKTGASTQWSREDVMEFLDETYGDGKKMTPVDLELLVHEVRDLYRDRKPHAPSDPPEVDQYITEFLLKLLSKLLGIPNVVHALLTIQTAKGRLGDPAR